MKFKFCSEGDCPLWALASLHALSALPAPLLRALLRHVCDELPDDGIMDILKDTSLSSRDEAARAAAVIRWVLQQCWRGECSGTQLTRDLLVLGVPRTHAAAFADAAREGADKWAQGVRSGGFMVNKLTDVSASPGPEGTTDTIKLTLHTDDVFTGEQKSNDILLDKTQAKELLADLKKAYKKMEELGSE